MSICFDGKTGDQAISDLGKDLTGLARIWCSSQRENFVGELLHCFCGLRADENAVASGSITILRLNELRFFALLASCKSRR